MYHVYMIHNVPTITLRRARDEVHGVVREMIVSGRLAPEERIEEIEMAQRIGVSRTPLREALIVLEAEGLVRSRPHRGYIVAPVDATLVRETYPILCALETTALRLASPRIATLVPQLRKLNRKLITATTTVDQYALDRAFHACLTEACANARLLGLLAIERTRTARFDGAHKRGTANHKRSCEEHGAIVEALARAEFDEAGRLLTEHWKRGTEVVATWLERREEE